MIYCLRFEGLKGLSEFQAHIQVAYQVNLNYTPKVDDYCCCFILLSQQCSDTAEVIFPLSLVDRYRESLKEDMISTTNKLNWWMDIVWFRTDLKQLHYTASSMTSLDTSSLKTSGLHWPCHWFFMSLVTGFLVRRIWWFFDTGNSESYQNWGTIFPLSTFPHGKKV